MVKSKSITEMYRKKIFHGESDFGKPQNWKTYRFILRTLNFPEVICK